MAGLFGEYIPDCFNDFLEIEIQLTPVEKRGDYYFKREDLFTIFDVCGAKARQAYNLIKNSNNDVICTAGSKTSPQIQIVSNICYHLNKKCYCFTTCGKLTPELEIAKKFGANIVTKDKKWLHINVVIHHLQKFCNENNYFEVPFGMQCWEAVKTTALQVKNIPQNVHSILITAGSGINLCGVLWGIKLFKRNIKVKAVSVGIEIKKVLEKYAPENYNEMLTIYKSSLSYERKIYGEINGIKLDPIYESKCLPFLEKGDLFWIIGKRMEE